MTSLALVHVPTTRPDGVRREPTARTIELASIVNLALAGFTFREIADRLYDPNASEEGREPSPSTKPQQDAVRGLLNSPEGQKALRYAISDQQEATDRFLVSIHLQALRTLEDELDGPKASDRIRAATAITALATKRIEISGPGGGPIDVNGTVRDILLDRVELMNERSKGIIEAHIVEPPVEVETSPVEILPSSAVADRIVEILATVPTPSPVVEATTPVAPTSPRRRMPAPIVHRPRGR